MVTNSKSRAIKAKELNALSINLRPDFREIENPEHRKFQEEKFKGKKHDLIDHFKKVPGFVDLAKQMKPGHLYKLVAPEGAVLQYNQKTGLYDAVIRKNGKIDKHPKFKAVGADGMAIVKGLASQCVLISISFQLGEIQKNTKKIQKGQHNDRVSEIRAGKQQFEDALACRHERNRRPILINAIQSLRNGIESLILETGDLIDEAPVPENRIFEHVNPLTNKLRQADETIGLAQLSFLEMLTGLEVLCNCYIELDEPEVARKALERFFALIRESCDLDNAVEKSQLLEVKNDVLPQYLWTNFLDCEKNWRKKLDILADPDSIFEIDFVSDEVNGD